MSDMSTTSAWIILIAAIFTNNILLANFLGMCSFLVCSSSLATALGLGAAVVFVTACTTVLNWLVYALLEAWHLEHLQFIIFIVVIAAFTQFVEMFVERFSPKLYFALGIFLPLIAVNCAILGAAMFAIIRHYNFVQTVGFGFGAGLGWMLAIMLMAGLRYKATYSNIPKPFRGPSIAMIITGVMAMAFMGFAGMVNIQ